MNFSAATVLLADANVVPAAAMIQILNAIGVRRVFHVADLDRGRQALDQMRIDLAIVDTGMGGTDGLELVGHIRRSLRAPANQIPVFAVSGDARASCVAAARDAGVDTFLTWPISVDALRRRIGAVLKGDGAFVQSDAFVGPDRRRRNVAAEGSLERRVASSLLVARDALSLKRAA